MKMTEETKEVVKDQMRRHFDREKNKIQDEAQAKLDELQILERNFWETMDNI